MSAIEKLKVVTILGTRPEIIRLSRVMAELSEHVHHVLVHTGQNYDYELNEIFFSDLGVQKPDYFLGVDTSSLGTTVGGILVESEKVLKKEKPDAILILGDTNSAISAYIARRLKIPIYHMEAGNRCFDLNVPEETNRKMVDHISDFNLVYTEHARRNLIAEGLHARRIYKTGSPMREILEHYRSNIESSDVLSRLSLKEKKYFVVSIHREENVDNPEVLENLLRALNEIATMYGFPVIVSTHPRTRNKIEAVSTEMNDLIHWMKPFGFHDYNKLQVDSLCVISDSGTIAEESSVLGFTAITPRFSIERPEAMDSGAIIACGTEADNILSSVQASLKMAETPCLDDVPEDYTILNTSRRVVKLIIGTARLSNLWDGVRGSR